MRHIALLGDSVFDNGAYVEPGEPAVDQQLRDRLDEEDRVTLLAVDGARIEGLERQLQRLPEDTTHLVISAGGNDLIEVMEVFDESVDTVGQGALRVRELQDRFRKTYREIMEAVSRVDLPVLLFTVYSGNFEDPDLRRVVETLLPVFNRVIEEEALDRGWPFVDLDRVCSRDEHYANPIEPSAEGGEQIARAISVAMREDGFDRARTVIYPGPEDLV